MNLDTQKQVATFLRERLAEDEQRLMASVSWHIAADSWYGYTRSDIERSLRAVGAKRRVIASVEDHRDGEWEGDPIHGKILSALAREYSNHEEFNPEWADG